MSIIVEDGTCPPGVNAYVSLEAAASHLQTRGLWKADPEGEDAAARVAALVRAADALNLLRFKGERAFPHQAMAWPRTGVKSPSGILLPADYIPEAVKRANIELAALIYAGTYDPLAPVERGGMTRAKSETSSVTVDVISESKSASVTWREDAPLET